MATPEQALATSFGQTDEFDPLFSFLQWEGQELGTELEEYIPGHRKSLPLPIIHRAELKFYKTFNRLLRVTLPADHSESWDGTRLRRGYALCQENDPAKITPLDGTSPPIHQTNQLHGELRLAGGTEKAVDDYLRFFCSTIHGEDGPFLILDKGNYKTILANTSIPETLRDEIQLGIRSEAEPDLSKEFEALGNPIPGSLLKRRKACVIYSSALFRAWFAIEHSAENPGMVQMLKDEPILTGLKVNIPRYANGTLFVLQKLDRSLSASPPEHYYYEKKFFPQEEKVTLRLNELTGNEFRGEIVFRDGEIHERK